MPEVRVANAGMVGAEASRLVVGGYDHVSRLCLAYAELQKRGMDADHLCALFRSSHAEAGMLEPAARDIRDINGLQLEVLCPALFDRVGLAESEPYGKGPLWMPERQATELWLHVREGFPVLLAGARSSREQIACSQVQLRHRPRFLHTFNFGLT
jgi:hypothetical protein